MPRIRRAASESNISSGRFCSQDYPAPQTQAGFTALHRAVYGDNAAIVEALIALPHADLNMKELVRARLGWAQQACYSSWVTTALCPAQAGLTPLHKAVECGRGRIVTQLLRHPRMDPNAQENNGWSPLHRAVHHGRDDVVSILLASEHVDPNVRENNGWTALHRAAHEGRTDIVRLLIAAAPRVDVNAADQSGLTALHLAVQTPDGARNSIIRELLASEHVAPNARETNGWTALHRASHHDHVDALDLLLGSGRVDLNVRECNGWTVLHRAAYEGRTDIVRQLIAAAPRIDVNAADHSGLTALHVAVQNADAARSSIILELLACDHAAPNAKETNGWTALHRAVHHSQAGAVTLLLASTKVDPNLRETVSKTQSVDEEVFVQVPALYPRVTSDARVHRMAGPR